MLEKTYVAWIITYFLKVNLSERFVIEAIFAVMDSTAVQQWQPVDRRWKKLPILNYLFHRWSPMEIPWKIGGDAILVDHRWGFDGIQMTTGGLTLISGPVSKIVFLIVLKIKFRFLPWNVTFICSTFFWQSSYRNFASFPVVNSSYYFTPHRVYLCWGW